MDRHRPDRFGVGGSGNNSSSTSGYNQDSYHNRRPSRFSDAPTRFSDSPMNRYPTNGSNISSNFDCCGSPNYRGGSGGSHQPFDSPPRHPPVGADVGGVPTGGFGSIGAVAAGGVGGFRPVGVGSGGFGSNYQAPPPLPPPQPLSGKKRGYPFSGCGSSPDRFDGSSFAKLFVGSVPRTASEEDIRPLFEHHGNVIEVALIKDKRTGQQQGCCFVKYATSEEADRAIRALHNQHSLPGGVAPIQVRYADGERERLGAVEYKLFVGSLDKHATEKEVEEIFSPYGHVEDVYLMRDEMKQSRGCGFVKYSQREMALASINGLNGIYRMRGVDQPLTVRFADPKRPRPGESRSGPSFGGPGFGPRFQAPGPRPTPNFGDPMGDRGPPNAWPQMSPQNIGPSPNAGIRGFGGQLLPRSELSMPSNQGGPLGAPPDGAPQGLMGSSTVQPGFNLHLQQVPQASQQIPPLQKPIQSPQRFPPSMQLHPQVSSYSHTQTSHAGPLHNPLNSFQTSFTQAPPSQQYPAMSGQLPSSQPVLQQGASSVTSLQTPFNTNLQSHSVSAMPNQQHRPVPAPAPAPAPLQPHQQSPSQLAQMLSQQTQNLQATFQSSQQAFSQLQQQVQMMQPSNQSLVSSQPPKQQQWPGIPPQTVASVPPTTLPSDIPASTSSASAAPVIPLATAPVKCNWTEHTSPEGFKYYYNSVTRESRWEKPEELTLFDQQLQQQPQQLHQKAPIQQPQAQSNTQAPPAAHQVPHAQQMPLQIQFPPQFRHQQQPPSFPSAFPASGVRGQPDVQSQEFGYGQLPAPSSSVNDPTCFQLGRQTSQEWMWKQKAAGSGS